MTVSLSVSELFVMYKFKFLSLCVVFLLGFQTIRAQENKHDALTGKEKRITIQPQRSTFTYTLNVVVTNCEIDGNIYVDCENETGQSVATYHVICENGQWKWGCGGSCYEQGGGRDLFDNCGITQQELLNLVLVIHDADTCCRGSGVGGHPCDTTTREIEDIHTYGFCHKIDVVCCGNAMKIIYKQFNCDQEDEIISLDEFWTLYDGQGSAGASSSYTIVGVQGNLSEDMRNKILNAVLNNNNGNPCNNNTPVINN